MSGRCRSGRRWRPRRRLPVRRLRRRGLGGVAGLLGRNGDRRWIDSARGARSTRCAALLTVCVVVLEVVVPARRLLGRAGRRPLLDDDADRLQADRDVVEPGRLAAALGVGALDRLLGACSSRPATAIARWCRGRPRCSAALAVFFIGLMLFGIVSPARTRSRSRASSPAPAEGVGLNPLLRHPAMAIHPPMLYSGYVLFAIPFAFAIGALITRRLDASWIRSTRRFALVAWTFLGSGSCSARSGPTASSAGAATGAGTRSRTRR